MALTNLNKETLNNLFEMITLNDHEHNKNKLIDSVKSNYSTYARLELISKQINMLKLEAENIVKNHQLNLDFNNINCGVKKVPGTYYYVYQKNNQKFISLISPSEWNTYHEFIAKVYFDYDYNFYVIE